MSIKENLDEMNEALKKLDKTGLYDVEKYCCSLMYQTSQLEYFYCCLAKDGDYDHTYYRLDSRPHIHELAYINIGRGYPHELMDGHWCYVVKDMKCKMLIIPCTKKMNNERSYKYAMNIQIYQDYHIATYCLRLSDIKSVDIQRIDVRKPFYKVLTPRDDIISFMKDCLL